jgi:lysophospholipase
MARSVSVRETTFLCALVLMLGGCRQLSPGPKSPPFDFTAHPGPEPSAFSQEANVEAAWAGPLKAFYRSATFGSFTGVDGINIPYAIFRASSPKGAVVVLPGRTEPMVNHAENAFDLVGQGYSVYLVELRGQGSAGRMLPDPERSHVVFAYDYATDTHSYITEVVKKDTSAPVFLLGFSLGAVVATGIAELYPDDARALSLGAPGFELSTLGLPPSLIASAGLTVCSSGGDSDYIINAGPYNRDAPFEGNEVTHSEARWRQRQRQIEEEHSLRVGGPTWRWVCQALVYSSRAESAGASNPLPTLLFNAGQDTVVNPGGQERYCTDAPHCTMVRYPTAKHGLQGETDEVRNDVLGKTVTFFNALVTP